MTVDFSRRSAEPELMDGDGVSQEMFSACLADLEKVNTVTFTRRPTLDFVGEALEAAGTANVPVILDVGFGAGDMLRAIERLCRRTGYRARLIGIDLNPRSEPFARSRSGPESTIEYRTGDLYDWPPGEPIDLIVCSQTTHHMSDGDIRRFLLWIEAHTRLGWFVSDLHRHWFAYHGFRLLSTVMRWHPMVRHDGPISVARSFTREDWERLLIETELDAVVEIEWNPLFRYAVSRKKW